MSSSTPTGRGTSQHIRVRTTRSGVAQSPEAQPAPELPAPVAHVSELHRQESNESEVSISSDQDKESGGENDDLHDVGKHGVEDARHELRTAADDSEDDDCEPIASAEASGFAARPAEPASGVAARPAEAAGEIATRSAEPARGSAARPAEPTSGSTARPAEPANGFAARATDLRGVACWYDKWCSDSVDHHGYPTEGEIRESIFRTYR